MGFAKKRNALKNKDVMKQLNPYEKPKETEAQIKKRKAERMSKAREYRKKHKKGDETFFKKLMKAFEKPRRTRSRRPRRKTSELGCSPLVLAEVREAVVVPLW